MPDSYDNLDGAPDDSEFPDIEAEFGGTHSTVEYHCTEEELAEAGFGDGFTVRRLGDMPEHESEFVPESALLDPMEYLDPPHSCSPRELLDMGERWDWTELRGLTRLAHVLTADLAAEPLWVAP
jgi:hypothetical protein